jgi:hypothetical protein
MQRLCQSVHNCLSIRKGNVFLHFGTSSGKLGLLTFAKRLQKNQTSFFLNGNHNTLLQAIIGFQISSSSFILRKNAQPAIHTPFIASLSGPWVFLR